MRNLVTAAMPPEVPHNTQTTVLKIHMGCSALTLGQRVAQLGDSGDALSIGGAGHAASGDGAVGGGRLPVEIDAVKTEIGDHICVQVASAGCKSCETGSGRCAWRLNKALSSTPQALQALRRRAFSAKARAVTARPATPQHPPLMHCVFMPAKLVYVAPPTASSTRVLGWRLLRDLMPSRTTSPLLLKSRPVPESARLPLA